MARYTITADHGKLAIGHRMSKFIDGICETDVKEVADVYKNMKGYKVVDNKKKPRSIVLEPKE